MVQRVRRLPEPKSGNPFIDTNAYTPWMCSMKQLVGMVMLLPIRMALNVLLFIPAMYCCVWLASRGWKPGKHLKPWQRFIMAHILRPIVRLWLLVVFGYWRISVRGKRASATDAPFTVIAPHSTVMDTWMFLLYTYGSMVSQREAANYPFVYRVALACEPIWVERSGGAGGGTRTASSTLEEMEKRLRLPGRWLPICVYPEGTRHNANAMLGYKTGAFQPGLPVQPVLFKFNKPEDSIWPKGVISPNMSFIRAMSRLWATCDVEYLPVYLPSKEERDDAQLFALNVQNEMAKALTLPTTDFSLEDFHLTRKAMAAGLPRDAALIEYNLINRLHNIRLPDLKVVLERFIQMNTSKSGVVGSNEFMMHLAWPIREHALLLFKEYDTCSDGREELRYREYVVGTLDLATKVPNAAQVVSDAFEALSDGQDQLSTTGILDAMHRRGFSDVSTDSVERFLYKMSQSSDLSVSGFASYVESNPDLNILLVWYLRGTATDV
eukprot:scpid39068/ scgid22096/ Lysophosphatidylcholine acyltransferase 2B; Acyltransferase-like 1-B